MWLTKFELKLYVLLLLLLLLLVVFSLFINKSHSGPQSFIFLSFHSLCHESHLFLSLLFSFHLLKSDPRPHHLHCNLFLPWSLFIVRCCSSRLVTISFISRPPSVVLLAACSCPVLMWVVTCRCLLFLHQQRSLPSEAIAGPWRASHFRRCSTFLCCLSSQYRGQPLMAYGSFVLSNPAAPSTFRRGKEGQINSRIHFLLSFPCAKFFFLFPCCCVLPSSIKPRHPSPQQHQLLPFDSSRPSSPFFFLLCRSIISSLSVSSSFFLLSLMSLVSLLLLSRRCCCLLLSSSTDQHRLKPL